MTHNILVWIETFKGKAVAVSYECLGEARQLADGGTVTAAVFGENATAIANEAITYGADQAIVCEDATLADYRAEPYIALLAKVATDLQLELIMAGASTRGRDVSSGLAVELEVGAMADCIAIEALDGQLVATRPVYAGKLLSHVVAKTTPVIMAGASTRGRDVSSGLAVELEVGAMADCIAVEAQEGHWAATRPVYAGKLLSQVVAKTAPVIITTRARAFPMPEATPGKTGAVTTVAPVLSEDQIATKAIDFVVEGEGEVSLNDARIIVSGGRGVGGPEGFTPIVELAKTLGAAVGASRAAVDAGWIQYTYQVGQTGKTVAPDLYIASGISGAIQHQAGMRTAKVIVAINKDPEAPIFKLARYGVVGDLFQIVPALNEEFKKRLGK